ncbi:hypothetical protein PSACC_02771 [Paramicrosporidium saccamoebae]|uniref:PX domain-containing protein n=1 Tax=Paramicrosporidium saccamoebae TaxID=1246581 RepID=A0A2H9TI29_9FUNG|nr:hypothetical protein PSACC_02771 [Paramicrosporidium saccamoebae]
MGSPDLNIESEGEGYQSTFWEGQGQQDSGLQDVPISAVPQHVRSSSFASSRTDESDSASAFFLNPASAPSVSISNPEKHGDGFKDAYVTYEITTEFPNDERFVVRRRYQDFIWLLGKLSEEIDCGIIVPPIPDKNRLGFMDRFSPEFIRKRQVGLERFLQRVLIHPRLARHSCLKSFLTKPILGIDDVQASPKVDSPTTGVAAVIEQVSDVVVNAFTKTRVIDEKFVATKKTIGVAEGHLDKITGLHGNLSISFKGLSDALMASGQAFSQVSSSVGQIEKIVSAGLGREYSTDTIPLRTTLGDYGQLLEERSAVAARMGEELDVRAHLLLIELGQYCRSAKNALKLRDNKQFEWQDLADHLESSREELAHLSGEATSSTAGVGEKIRANKSAMVNFIAGRFDSMRGIDPITARADRIRKLEAKVKELEETSVSSQDQSKEVDAMIDSEFVGFTLMLSKEVRSGLVPSLRDTWTQYHQQDLELFSSFLRDTLDAEQP